jgi:hypothetical protein
MVSPIAFCGAASSAASSNPNAEVFPRRQLHLLRFVCAKLWIGQGCQAKWSCDAMMRRAVYGLLCSSARMTDRYTHFEKSFEEQAIRNNKPSFGFSVKPGPVLVAKTG